MTVLHSAPATALYYRLWQHQSDGLLSEQDELRNDLPVTEQV